LTVCSSVGVVENGIGMSAKCARIRTDVTTLVHLAWKRRLVPLAWLDFDHAGFAGVVAFLVARSRADWGD
jgi:hypothetical protein